MDDYLKQELERNLSKSQSILIAIAKDADFDALAAGLALYLSLKKLGKRVTISGPDPRVSDAQSLYAVDKISKSGDSSDLVITIDGAVDKVDKISHSLDGKVLKLVVHSLAGTPPIPKEEIGFEYANISADFIAAIGYNSQDQLKQEVTHEQNINSNAWIISINKGKVNQKIAQANLDNPQASGICEIASTAIRSLNLPVDEDVAFNLYSGLSYATNMFSPQLSTPAVLETAGYLIKMGAGRASLASASRPKPPADPFVQKSSQTEETSKIGKALPADFSKFFDKTSVQKSLEQVEKEEDRKSWLKPPKIYRGSKSFDSES